MNEMMASEIEAQSEILSLCLIPLYERVAQVTAPEGRVYAGGCGDSAFAPAALDQVFSGLGYDIEPRTSMQLSSFTRFTPTDTVILSSISGGTKRTVEAAHTARKAGARVIALTCNGESNLAFAADETIILPFSPISRKTPHTLDYSVTLLALVQLVSAWAGRPIAEMQKLIQTVPALLKVASGTAASIVKKIDPAGKLFFLGAGPGLAHANYAAAKFHEAGGIVAIAAETENFVHGMNFMVEPADFIVLLSGNNSVLRRSQQIAAAFNDFAGCEIISPEFSPEETSSFSHVLEATFVLQYLCLNFANISKLQVEQPRAGRINGDKHLAIQTTIMAERP